eukprot:NODE_822_length_3913_cov_0.283167.p1 type:complete len:443 gc:universal NODE_822_length_3913_cov_0.283167:102-1430(+)
MILLHFGMSKSINCEDLINLAIGFEMDTASVTQLQIDDCCGQPGNSKLGVECNEFNQVFKIKWDYFDLTGPFNNTAWDALPLLTFSAVSNKISGIVPTLQSTLKYFYVSKNSLTGQLPNLPQGMAEFGVDNNNITGSISVPDSISYLYVMYNKLIGSFNSFPPQAKDLYLNDNLLSGSLPALPLGLIGLGLQNNQFSGEIPKFADSIIWLNLENNGFTGKIPSLHHGAKQVYLGFNQLTGEVPEFPNSTYDISLQNNRLNGTFPAIPLNISKLYINNNQFTGSIMINAPQILHIEHNYFTHLVIENTDDLKECDVSENRFNVNSNEYLYMTSKCKRDIEGGTSSKGTKGDSTLQIELVESTLLYQKTAIPKDISEYSTQTKSATKITLSTRLPLASQTEDPNVDEPVDPANLWVIVGSIAAVLVFVNFAIQLIKSRIAKPIA